MKRRKRFIVVAGICCLMPAVAAVAADYPTRPIRIVVPFPPGGTSDILTRILGERLNAAFRQQIVVDNRPGAGTIIGTEIVARANPDGHTLYMAFVSHAINPYVYAKLPYDTERDFTPIALVAVSPNVVVVTPSLPVNSIKDLIALAKAKPGQINYASSGVGTNSHLSAEMINAMAGIKMNHVAYKGAPQANGDVAAGAVQLHIPSMPVSMPFITAGRLKAIAVTSSTRSPVLPNVPTVAETLPGYESLAWYGLLAPRGTPPAVVARLNEAIEAALQSPAVVNAYSMQGADPSYRDSAGFAQFIRVELKRWAVAVKAAGLKPGTL